VGPAKRTPHRWRIDDRGSGKEHKGVRAAMTPTVGGGEVHIAPGEKLLGAQFAPREQTVVGRED
jgi:hypothetical protein